MKNENIAVLEKTEPSQIRKKESQAPSGCCGGPSNNKDACCALDEHKKSQGEEGCGCNSSGNIKPGNSCC